MNKFDANSLAVEVLLGQVSLEKAKKDLTSGQKQSLTKAINKRKNPKLSYVATR